MLQETLETFCPSSREDWRNWLQQNHQVKQSVWLIYFKKSSKTPTLSYSDAVDEALCFGWIDSTRKSLGADQFTQFFCRRKPQSGWSKVNKQKVNDLINQGLMTQAGFDCIEQAKQNGSWTILDEVEELIVPRDLDFTLTAHAGAKDFFLSLSKSTRKQMLQWLVLAKRPQTRQNRIDQIAAASAENRKLKAFY
jgi:uncharacterized protein YdeI (YjbR/CyaY-like superfamily)